MGVPHYGRKGNGTQDFEKANGKIQRPDLFRSRNHEGLHGPDHEAEEHGPALDPRGNQGPQDLHKAPGPLRPFHDNLPAAVRLSSPARDGRSTRPPPRQKTMKSGSSEARKIGKD